MIDPYDVYIIEEVAGESQSARLQRAQGLKRMHPDNRLIFFSDTEVQDTSVMRVGEIKHIVLVSKAIIRY